MSLNFSNKRVVVTAGTYGIGRAVAEAFLEAGAKVALCGRSLDKLKEIKKKYGDQVLVEQVDLFDVKCVQVFAKNVLKAWQGVDVIVHNPPHTVKTNIGHMTLADWQKSYEAIYPGMIALIDELLPALKKSGRGSVVVISSISAVEPIVRMAASSVFRGGMAAFVKLMAFEYGRDQIRFNAVMPGYTDTPAIQNNIQKMTQSDGITEEQVRARFAQSIALGRIAKPEEIAQSVLFLSSPMASYITGTTLLVDGGLVKGVG